MRFCFQFSIWLSEWPWIKHLPSICLHACFKNVSQLLKLCRVHQFIVCIWESCKSNGVVLFLLLIHSYSCLLPIIVGPHIKHIDEYMSSLKTPFHHDKEKLKMIYQTQHRCLQWVLLYSLSSISKVHHPSQQVI